MTVTGYVSVRFPEIDWRGSYPDLAALCDRLRHRESLQAALPYPRDITDEVA